MCEHVRKINIDIKIKISMYEINNFVSLKKSGIWDQYWTQQIVTLLLIKLREYMVGKYKYYLSKNNVDILRVSQSPKEMYTYSIIDINTY